MVVVVVVVVELEKVRVICFYTPSGRTRSNDDGIVDKIKAQEQQEK